MLAHRYVLAVWNSTGYPGRFATWVTIEERLREAGAGFRSLTETNRHDYSSSAVMRMVGDSPK